LAEWVTDPVSHQRALKSATVLVNRLDYGLFGFAVSSQQIPTEALHYYSMARCEGGWRYEFAQHHQCDAETLIENLFQRSDTETVEFKDDTRARCFHFEGETLVFACVVDTQPVAASRTWLASLLTQKHSRATRNSLLAGFKSNSSDDIGEIVCTCMAVGSKQIEAAISQRGCASINEVADSTGAGSNCGSCRAEIATFLKHLP